MFTTNFSRSREDKLKCDERLKKKNYINLQLFVKIYWYLLAIHLFQYNLSSVLFNLNYFK